MHSIRKNKIYKYCLTGIIALFSLICILFLALPTLISSPWGKEKLEHFISYKTGVSVSFEGIALSILGPQEIKGMEVKNVDKTSSLTVASASFDSSFLKILFQNAFDTPLQFSNLNLAVIDSPNPILFENVSGEFRAHPLIIKLKGNSKEGELKGDFDLDIALDGIDLSDLFNLASHPEMIFADSTILSFKAKFKNFPVAFLDLALQKYNKSSHLLSSTIGHKLDLTLSKSKLSQNKNLLLEVSALAPNLTANLNLQMGLDKILTTGPSTLMFLANQELLENFYPLNAGFELAKPSTVLIAIHEFRLPYDLKNREYDLSKLMFKGRLDFHEAFLKSHTSLPDIALQKFTTNIETDEDSEDILIKMQGDAKESEHPIKVALETTIPKSLNFKRHPFPPILIDLKHIPVALIGHFFQLDDTLPKIVGDHADLKIEALLKAQVAELEFSFHSEKIFIPSIRFKVDKNWTMQEPAYLHYHFNESFAKTLLPENAPVSLNTNQPLVMTFYLQPLALFDQIDDLTKSPILGEINLEELVFNIKASNETFAVKNVAIPIKIDFAKSYANITFAGMTKHSRMIGTGSFAGKALFNSREQQHFFDIDWQQINAAGNKSDVSLKGNLENLLTETGDLNIHGMTCAFDATIANLPTPFFCQVACLENSMHKKIEVLFGDFLNANIHVALKELDGMVQAHVSGLEGSFHLDSRLQNGTLFLNQPFEAKFQVTPRLGSSILQDIFPVLSGVVSSDQPILIAINHEGFRFPLKELDISKIEIPGAILSLGHVQFDNSGELAKILSLLTPPNSDLISVWFTPLYFAMHEGIFKLERTDMLISNQFPIATWGKVDFILDKVKMMIGMSGEALSHAFKIKDLDSSYMLQIPLIGTINQATIDKPTATTKIGALIAQAQGGPKGLVLGAFLSIASGALTEKGPPKPTTTPLPWENMLKKETHDEAEIACDLPPKEPAKEKKKKKKFNLEKILNNLEVEQIFEHLK